MNKKTNISIDNLVAKLGLDKMQFNEGMSKFSSYLSESMMLSIKRLSYQALLITEKLKEAEESDPILHLLFAICEGDNEALSQFISEYYLHQRSLSYTEREQTKQQLGKEDMLNIAYSTVHIWLSTFSLNYSAYFSLSQEERNKILVDIIAKECRKEILGETVDDRKKAPLEETDYRLAICDNEPKGSLFDLSKLGFDIDKLTKKEIAVLYDALNALDQGYKLPEYWGRDYWKKIKMLERLKAKRGK